jgi:hypothetical protein
MGGVGGFYFFRIRTNLVLRSRIELKSNVFQQLVLFDQWRVKAAQEFQKLVLFDLRRVKAAQVYQQLALFYLRRVTRRKSYQLSPLQSNRAGIVTKRY